MSEKTKVIFRKWKGSGDIIALFPELPGTNNPHTCMSYERVGQHGAASDDLTCVTLPAKPQEYEELDRELRGIGYNLRVVKRMTQAMRENRWRELGEVQP